MKHLFKNPLFYTTFLSLLALGLIIASYVFGWTTPTASPPAGNITLSSSQWTTSGTNIYYNGGNVGIGTSTPSYILTVELPDSGTLNKILFNGLRSANGASPVEFRFGAPNSPAATNKKNFSINNKNANLGYDFNSIQFRQQSDDWSTSIPIMSLTHGGSSVGGVAIGDYAIGTVSAPAGGLIVSGNVGIGTTTPSEKLEVAGNIKLSGSSPTYKITNVVAPTASSDVATKGYVDAASSGMKYWLILQTSASYNGNLGGYAGANNKCAAEFGEGCVMLNGSIFASAFEGGTPIVFGLSSLPSTGWWSPMYHITNYPSSGTYDFLPHKPAENMIGYWSNYNYSDCYAWTNANQGNYGATISSYGGLYSGDCSLARKIWCACPK